MLENPETRILIFEKTSCCTKGKAIITQVQNALNIYRDIAKEPPCNEKLITFLKSQGIAKDHDEAESFMKLKAPVLIDMLKVRIYELLDDSYDFFQTIDELIVDLLKI